MTRNEKQDVNRRVKRHSLFLRADWPVKLLLVLIFIAGAILVWNSRDALRAAGESDMVSPIMKMALDNCMAAYLLLGGAVLVVLAVYPFDKKFAQDQLQSIGLVNHTGAVPVLIRKHRDPDNHRVTIWEFRSLSIPLVAWENKRPDIEAAFDINIVQMSYTRGKSRVLLHTVPAQTDLPSLLEWKNEYLSQNVFELVMGESFLGPVTVNLANIPHILLGGSTGSGKSVLLKLLLMQAIQKGADVYIADFKGGVDFIAFQDKGCQICTKEQELLAVLTGLENELERRKELFLQAKSSSLSQYNRVRDAKLKRCIFACDEVAEVTGRNRPTKELKELAIQIESKLETIARLGRAFGIHLILSTQRPDAVILSGQIRNNLDCRVCGRADNNLSQIILDNTDAANLIPKNSKGRFLLHDRTLFQGYLIDEDNL